MYRYIVDFFLQQLAENKMWEMPSLDNVGFPMMRNLVYSLFNLRKYEENLNLSSLGQLVGEEGGRTELGLLER